MSFINPDPNIYGVRPPFNPLQVHQTGRPAQFNPLTVHQSHGIPYPHFMTAQHAAASQFGVASPARPVIVPTSQNAVFTHRLAHSQMQGMPTAIPNVHTFPIPANTAVLANQGSPYIPIRSAADDKCGQLHNNKNINTTATTTAMDCHNKGLTAHTTHSVTSGPIFQYAEIKTEFPQGGKNDDCSLNQSKLSMEQTAVEFLDKLYNTNMNSQPITGHVTSANNMAAPNSVLTTSNNNKQQQIMSTCVQSIPHSHTSVAMAMNNKQPIGGMTTNMVENLINHSKQKHGSGGGDKATKGQKSGKTDPAAMFVCEYCNKVFKRKDHLNRHRMKIHQSTTKQHESTAAALALHHNQQLKNENNENNTANNAVGTTNPQVENVYNAYVKDLKESYTSLVVTKDTPYQCEECHKYFTRKDHVFRHKLTHTGYKPYECDVCSKAFCRKDHMIRHRNIHTKDRPHPCTLCEKVFSRKDHLDRHIEKHPHDNLTPGGAALPTLPLTSQPQPVLHTAPLPLAMLGLPGTGVSIPLNGIGPLPTSVACKVENNGSNNGGNNMGGDNNKQQQQQQQHQQHQQNPPQQLQQPIPVQQHHNLHHIHHHPLGLSHNGMPLVTMPMVLPCTQAV